MALTQHTEDGTGAAASVTGMRNPALVPARITDRNGKATTVYRRPPVTATSQSIPGPSSPSQAPQQTRVEFHPEPWVADLIASAAPQPTSPVPHASVVLTHDEAFGYLRFGVGMKLGAAMHAVFPDPGYWEHTEAGQRLAERHCAARTVPPIADSVELMRNHGYAPAEVERMLDNGLKDEHLRGRLTAEQTATLFTKFRLVPDPLSSKDDTAATLRCLTDGTIPFALVEEGTCSPRTIMSLAEFFEESREDEREGRRDSGFHTAVEEDPSLWHTIPEIMRSGPPTIVAVSRAWTALETFGEHDCRRFGVRWLLTTAEDGRPLGHAIREARAHGMTDDAIEGAITEHRGRSSVLLAIARGESAPAIADGWL